MLPIILRENIKQLAISHLAKSEFESLRCAIFGLQILDIDNVHPSFLPWIAWWFRADFWNDAWSIEKQRVVVKNALMLFKYKGTEWAVERVLELVGFDAVVTPWHKMSPLGVNGTFRVDVNLNANKADYKTIAKLIDSNKRASQHWHMIVRNPRSEGGIYGAVVIRSRKRIKVRN